MIATKRRVHDPEPVPEWVLRYPDLQSPHETSPYHLKRRGPWFNTLCGVASHGWRRWPGLGCSRPAVDECCGRCMRIATAHILEGRYVRA